MRKKDTTPKPPAGDLPALLAKVLHHPDTPADIYNRLVDYLTNFVTVDVTTPQFIAHAIRADKKKARKPRGKSK